MASIFDTLMANDVPMCLALFAEDVIYTPQGGSSKTIKAVVNRERFMPTFNDGNNIRDFDTLDIHISSRNDAEGHVSPTEAVRAGQTGDTVTIDGQTWYLREIMERNAGGMHALRLSNKLFPYGNWGNV